MPALRENTTAVVFRGETVGDGGASEPYEAGWAAEAMIFILAMDEGSGGAVSVQVSPDGMHWADEGTEIAVPAEGEVAFARIAHFGNWLRLEARVPAGGTRRIHGTLHFKG